MNFRAWTFKKKIIIQSSAVAVVVVSLGDFGKPDFFFFPDAALFSFEPQSPPFAQLSGYNIENNFN